MRKGTKKGFKRMTKAEESIFLGSLIIVSALWGVVAYKLGNLVGWW